jgi:HSP20 family protein
MAENAPVKPEAKEQKVAVKPQARHPFENLRQEMNQLFDEFDRDLWMWPFRRAGFGAEPFWRRELRWSGTPAVDITESDKAYEISAELPGLDEKDIEVKLVNGGLTVKGEKREEKEEKKKDYYLHERHFGSFERYFRLPDEVEADKIEASFRKGVLTLTLPKKPEAQKAEKKIAVKAA